MRTTGVRAYRAARRAADLKSWVLVAANVYALSLSLTPLFGVAIITVGISTAVTLSVEARRVPAVSWCLIASGLLVVVLVVARVPVGLSSRLLYF
jgi:hypothetical protein